MTTEATWMVKEPCEEPQAKNLLVFVGDGSEFDIPLLIFTYYVMY